MTISSRSSRLGFLTGVALLASGLAASHASGAEPVRLTAAQLDTVVAGVSAGAVEVSGDVLLISSDVNRFGGSLRVGSRSNLSSSSSSGSVLVWGYARGPGAQAYAQTDGAAQGALTTKQTINLRGRMTGVAWAASATGVGGASYTPPSRL